MRKCSGNGNTGLTVGALGGAIATVVLRGDVETLIAAEPVFERVRAGWTGRRVGLAGFCSRIARLIARALNPTVTTVIISGNINTQRATGLELGQVHAVCTNRSIRGLVHAFGGEGSGISRDTVLSGGVATSYHTIDLPRITRRYLRVNAGSGVRVTDLVTVVAAG